MAANKAEGGLYLKETRDDEKRDRKSMQHDVEVGLGEACRYTNLGHPHLVLARCAASPHLLISAPPYLLADTYFKNDLQMPHEACY